MANRVEKSTAFSTFQNPSQLSSLFPPPKFAVAPLSKMASLFKKKKNHLMLSVYVNSAWTVSVWLLPMSPCQPWSTADALGSRAAGTTSRSGVSSGYHQLLAPGSCLVFPAFFFYNYIFLPTLFLSPVTPALAPTSNWRPFRNICGTVWKNSTLSLIKKHSTSQPQLEGAWTLLELWEGSGAALMSRHPSVFLLSSSFGRWVVSCSLPPQGL